MSTVFWLAVNQGDRFHLEQEEDYESFKYLTEELDAISRRLGITPFASFVGSDNSFDSEEELLSGMNWHDPHECLVVVEALEKAAPDAPELAEAFKDKSYLSLKALLEDLSLCRKRLAEAAEQGWRIHLWDTF